jgi:hypothetical protein
LNYFDLLQNLDLLKNQKLNYFDLLENQKLNFFDLLQNQKLNYFDLLQNQKLNYFDLLQNLDLLQNQKLNYFVFQNSSKVSEKRNPTVMIIMRACDSFRKGIDVIIKKFYISKLFEKNCGFYIFYWFIDWQFGSDNFQYFWR